MLLNFSDSEEGGGAGAVATAPDSGTEDAVGCFNEVSLSAVEGRRQPNAPESRPARGFSSTCSRRASWD